MGCQVIAMLLVWEQLAQWVSIQLSSIAPGGGPQLQIYIPGSEDGIM